jgi:hypothetical protein
MLPRDYFAVGVRLMGLWECLRGVEYAMTVIALRLQISPSTLGPFEQRAELLNYLFYATSNIAIGVCLLVGAEQLTAWVFRERKEPPAFDDEVSTTVREP